jgi:hypothetical protein
MEEVAFMRPRSLVVCVGLTTGATRAQGDFDGDGDVDLDDFSILKLNFGK